MTMRTSNAKFDYESLTKQNFRQILDVPMEHIYIITRQLANSTWAAHVTRATENPPDKRRDTGVAHESGRSLGEVLEKLHSASSRAVEEHFRTRQFGLGPKVDNDNEEDSEDDNESIYSDSEDEDAFNGSRLEAKPRTAPEYVRPSTSEVGPNRVHNMAPRGLAATRNHQAPDPKQRSMPSNATWPPNSRGPPFPGHNPPPNAMTSRQHHQATPPQPLDPRRSTPVPSTAARILIDFKKHGTFEIAETIPMTQNDVLTAATRHCDMLMGIKSLRASLKSVARGGTKILVHGCVVDLVAMVGALPERGEVPVFEVEVTRGPGV